MKKVATFIRSSNHPHAQDSIQIQEQKLNDYCKAKGYSICDSVTTIGDRNSSYPTLLNLLKNAKDKDIEKIIMVSTNRIIGHTDEIKAVNKAFESSNITLETIDGSHSVLNSPNIVNDFLSLIEIEEDE